MLYIYKVNKKYRNIKRYFFKTFRPLVELRLEMVQQ